MLVSWEARIGKVLTAPIREAESILWPLLERKSGGLKIEASTPV